MHISQKRHLMSLWHKTAFNRETCVETADGVIHYQLVDWRGKLKWQYGSACNTGLLTDGEIEYDESVTFCQNIENVVMTIIDKYGEYEND